MLKIKRAYDPPELSDGARILVDRLWPRGVRKDGAAIQEWLKDLAPSNELRQWFSHEPDRWEEFKKRYAAELATPEKEEMLRHIAGLARDGDVTLVYAARDRDHNNARALLDLIGRMQSAF